METREVAAMGQVFEAAADNLVWVLLASVIVVGIVGSTLREIVKTKSRERTRREIAAYIAEGSMTPEQGERLMAAGRSKWEDA